MSLHGTTYGQMCRFTWLVQYCMEYLVKVLLRAKGFPAGVCFEREWLILTYCTAGNLLPCSSPVIYLRCLAKDLNGLVD